VQNLGQGIHVLDENLPEAEDVSWFGVALFLGDLREKKFFDS
jgi:hypothetical protein